VTPVRGQPLVVYGPRSLEYDFGPGHPLTPERFGPGISLLKAVGASRFLAPEPASDEDLRLVHTAAYIDAVRFADQIPYNAALVGIGPGDNPAFPGMHEASAAVAGGSLAAMDRILAGEERHVFHPGGGLHHAMPARASGFCIYDDPALAIARARAAGRRVLYVDLDVHHGDGVQAAFWEDPAVMTVSLHESGHYLFPGTGFVDEIGEGRAAGTKVNVPFEPGTSDPDWLAALEAIVPALAVVHGPDVLVTQHGCDSHAFDPLAHLDLTTRAMHRASRLVDELADRHCAGRWLATGGGGYDIHRVVPRAWALVWSAQAHQEPDDVLPAAWRTRWSDAALTVGRAIPERLFDPETLVGGSAGGIASNRKTLDEVLRVAVPAILRGARAPRPSSGDAQEWGSVRENEAPVLVGPLGELPRGARLAPGVVSIARPGEAAAALRGWLASGARATVAVAGTSIVGLVLVGPPEGTALSALAAGTAAPDTPGATHSLLALGVVGPFRRRGLARELLARALADKALRSARVVAQVTPAERDPIAPDPWPDRADAAWATLSTAGFVDLGERAGGAVGPRGSRTLIWLGPGLDRP
jgi:acetoin utilization protein AcuC